MQSAWAQLSLLGISTSQHITPKVTTVVSDVEELDDDEVDDELVDEVVVVVVVTDNVVVKIFFSE